jgi:hypothetical protein
MANFDLVKLALKATCPGMTFCWMTKGFPA